MLTIIEHESGPVYSVKTFRPLLIFPWNSSVWRVSPFATCIATISYDHKRAAATGHQELVALLNKLKIGPDMSEPFKAMETYGKSRTGTGVKSYRVYSGHAVEGKVKVETKPLVAP